MCSMGEGESTAMAIGDAIADIDPGCLLALETGDIRSAHVSRFRKMQSSSVMSSQNQTSSAHSKNCPSELPIPPGTTVPGGFSRISAPLGARVANQAAHARTEPPRWNWADKAI